MDGTTDVTAGDRDPEESRDAVAKGRITGNKLVSTLVIGLITALSFVIGVAIKNAESLDQVRADNNMLAATNNAMSGISEEQSERIDRLLDRNDELAADIERRRNGHLNMQGRHMLEFMEVLEEIRVLEIQLQYSTELNEGLPRRIAELEKELRLLSSLYAVVAEVEPGDECLFVFIDPGYTQVVCAGETVFDERNFGWSSPLPLFPPREQSVELKQS